MQHARSTVIRAKTGCALWMQRVQINRVDRRSALIGFAAELCDELLQLGQLIGLDLQLDEMLLQIARKATEVMEADRFSIFLHNPETNELYTTVALGMGREVVEGGRCLTFCPRYPQNLVQFSSVKDVLSNSQSEFWALQMNHQPQEDPIRGLREVRFPLRVAEDDGTLHAVGSTYSRDNDAVYDGLSRPGARVVTFAPVLKHDVFPLAPILEQLSRVGEDALGQPVEIEFAVSLPRGAGNRAEFGFLQIRPLVMSREGEELRMEEVDPAGLVCRSTMVLGNGRIQNLCDAVVVDFHRFERGRSQEVAEAVADFNARLGLENRPYLLIGVGRLGSNDPWLGIPVEWDEISGARVIVEAGFRDFRVIPSQGSHFFQNLMAFQVGYFTVNPDAGEGFVDWPWLAEHEAVEENGCVRHLCFRDPLLVIMNGKSREGMIFKPGFGPGRGAR